MRAGLTNRQRGTGRASSSNGPGLICNMPERANLVNSKTFFSDNKLVQPTKLFLHSTNIPRNMVDLMHHTSVVVNTVSSRPLDCMREFEIQGEIDSTGHRTQMASLNPLLVLGKIEIWGMRISQI